MFRLLLALTIAPAFLANAATARAGLPRVRALTITAAAPAASAPADVDRVRSFGVGRDVTLVDLPDGTRRAQFSGATMQAMQTVQPAQRMFSESDVRAILASQSQSRYSGSSGGCSGGSCGGGRGLIGRMLRR